MSRPKKNIGDIKAQVEKEKQDLANIEKNEQPIPELINSTNILRLNEHLKKINDKKDIILQAYSKYTIELESLLSSMLQVQNELRTKLRSKQAKHPRKKTPSKKTRTGRKKTKKAKKGSKSKAKSSKTKPKRRKHR